MWVYYVYMRRLLHRAKLLIILLIALGPGNTPMALATDTQVLLSQVQVRKISANDRLSRLHEAIVIKNDSEDDVDITNWCVYYASVAVDFTDGTKRKIGCFIPKDSGEKIFLKGEGLVRFGSFDNDFYDPTVFYSPSFSQGLGNEKGKLLLLNGSEEKDRVEWGVHPGAFKLAGEAVFGRKLNEAGLLVYSGLSQDDFEIITEVDLTTVTGTYKKQDACLGIEGFQDEGDPCIVKEEETPTEEQPKLIVPTELKHTIQISEFLANPKGSDAGNEFIEIYNYGEDEISLARYSIAIEGSTAATKKVYKLPDILIRSGEYIAIYNTNEQNFALNNTAGKISLMYGEALVDEASYTSTKEGYSWSLIGDDFSLSLPSPNSQNRLTDAIEAMSKTLLQGSTMPKPCAEGQERNPATGRCRKIATVAESAPCKVGQERNPATGRCRNIAQAKVPAPCKPGQERNPTTNRCRNIKRTTPEKVTDGVKVMEVSESGTKWIWLAAGIAMAGVLTYIIWEWRKEIGSFIKGLRIKKKGKSLKSPKDDL